MRTVAIVVALLSGVFITGLNAEPVRSTEMKVLGLIGGTSWHSTIECYRYINQSVNDYYDSNTNPPLVLYNMNQAEIHALQLGGRWDRIATLLSSAALKLKAAGAQAITLCANTPYKVYPEVSRKTQLPILHIADAAGIAIREAGLKKVGLIGTIYTMEDAFIKDWLMHNYGIEVLVPSSPAARKELHRLVQEELGMGIFTEETKSYVMQQIEDLAARGGQGIVLGCTEFPLIISQEDVNFPVFDTTRLHSQMAVDFILGRYIPGVPDER